jgi:bifunctional UDP-N-acetylglucosamine pyrophosphorylase/glucosamine-1-phosphate N-acetyltransferase
MLNIVILAAGLGKRMQSDLPKVLHPIAGKPMLAHVLDSARKLNPDQIIVVVGHGADRVKQAFGDQPDVTFALQVPQQGTGHAVQLAAPMLVETGAGQAGGASGAGVAALDTTLVLYGDVPLVRSDTMARLIDARADGMAVLTQTLDDPSGYGRIVRDAAGAVQCIVEHKDATAQQRAIREVNTGILALPTAWLKKALPRIGNDNAQNEYYLTDLIGLAAGDGLPVNSSEPGQAWETLGVNSRVQQAQVERIWQGEQARLLLEQGVTLADPARLDVRGTLQCGRDVFIDVGCVFEGSVTLADGVRIGPFCVVKNAAIGAGTAIDAYTHVHDATIADDARIGPYARLRPGAGIGTGAHVGNFVEIKKSTLGKGAKANHLSYIGDASIGERVNIGAGTITCNYDGVNKFRTVIEDDAFIGSDTQLVAPVTVGKGATLGAGTTLTRDAPAGQLTLSRPRQTSVPGWKRPEKKT